MENDEQLIAAVIDLQKIFLKAAMDKNSSFMTDNLHTEFIFTSPRAVILNKEGFTNDFVLNPNIKFEIFELTDEKAIIIDNTAIVYGLVQAKPVGQADLWERVTFALIKEDDKWLILTMNATFIAEKK
ncbi:MAG: hypothetical protein JWR38_2023 [Mucilaginibacter sp.]|nr:hypothetical protein [Mucilaginibacter sp.]